MMLDIYSESSFWRTQAVEQAIEWLPRIAGAAAILLVAWILARVIRWVIMRAVSRVSALRDGQAQDGGQPLAALLGDIAFWLVFLVGLVAALQPLGLSQVLEPVRALTTTAFAALPSLIKAAIIFLVGLVIARIVRKLVEGALLAINPDGWMRKAGLTEAEDLSAGAGPAAAAASRKDAIPRSVGTLVFFLIMIPITIAALEAVGIEAISDPATQMLRAILAVIPKVLGAVILLGIGYFIGKLASEAVRQILPSLGFDRSVSALGLSSEAINPSRTVGTGVMIAILLFFAIKAAELLDSPIIAVMLAQALKLGTRIVFGTAIILAGVAIARIVTRLVRGAGADGWLPAMLSWSITALAVAMGLRFMGLANEIVIIAFASVIGSAAVACALAFGLGGRKTAHELLEQWRSSRNAGSPPSRSSASRPPSGE